MRRPMEQSASPGSRLRRFAPLLGQLRHHTRADYAADGLAGMVVAIMLVPQAMAYALLAGLPAEVGLYASILPVVVYGLMGTSRVLAVGPVAIVSILVAEALEPLAEQGSAAYVELAIALAVLAGVIQVVMAVVRAGFLVNFLSHPVISGFTTAAAIVIGFSQLTHLLGIQGGGGGTAVATAARIVGDLEDLVPQTAVIGLGALGLLVLFKRWVRPWLERRGVPQTAAMVVARAGPLVAVVLGIAVVAGFGLEGTVAVVGTVPSGLPSFTVPSLDGEVIGSLLPAALAIVFVGYMESISVGKALAARRGERLDADGELLALGAADLAAAVTGGYPVTGGFSRSAVNDDAGARSGMAAIVTAALVGLTVLVLTPAFASLPRAVLAAVILVAVAGLLDFRELVHVWRFDRADGVAWAVTFVAVLTLGVEAGIVLGATVALVLYLWRASRPHVATLGRIPGSEIYRNVERFQVETRDDVVVLRVDESLTFPTVAAFEEAVTEAGLRRGVEAIVLVLTPVNVVDASGLHALERLDRELGAAGIALHLAAVKGPVRDRLAAAGLLDDLGPDRVHLSAYSAMEALDAVAEPASTRA